jgi:hypothetical protein
VRPEGDRIFDIRVQRKLPDDTLIDFVSFVQLLSPAAMCMCVCVCVCVRERERESSKANIFSSFSFLWRKVKLS